MNSEGKRVPEVTDANKCSKVIGFIAGMSRAGTSSMTRAMNGHAKVAAFGETCFWGRLWLAPAIDQAYYTSEQLDCLCDRYTKSRLGGPDTGASRFFPPSEWSECVQTAFDDLEGPSGPTDAFQAISNAVGRITRKSLIVEKTPHHVHHIQRILKYFPDARFIIMMREPYGFLKSYKNQGAQYSNEARDTFRQLYHPAIAALVWRRYMSSIQQLSDRDSRFLIVRLEQLRANEEEVLHKVFEHFGLGHEAYTKPAELKNSSLTEDQLDLDNCDLFWLWLIAGNKIRTYGVELRRPTLAPFSWVMSSLSLLPWFFRNAQVLKKAAPGNAWNYFLKYVKG